MKCAICGKEYKCNRCAFEKHIESHRMTQRPRGEKGKRKKRVTKYDTQAKNFRNMDL